MNGLLRFLLKEGGEHSVGIDFGGRKINRWNSFRPTGGSREPCWNGKWGGNSLDGMAVKFL